MKAKEIREMQADARQKELHGLLKEQFGLRMQLATGQMNNHARLRKVRKDIARIRTIMNEQQDG